MAWLGRGVLGLLKVVRCEGSGGDVQVLHV